jgi:cell division septation protein DedD
VQSAPAPSVAPPPQAATSGLSSLAATIQALEAEAAAEKAAASAKPKPAPAKTEKKPEPAAEPAKQPETASKLPSRHWVQVAGVAEKDGLKTEFARIRAKAPKLLAGKGAWTTPLRFTNRLLVGPFKSDAEAQDFVNELAKADLAAFTWTSPAGQEIVQLAAK